MRDLKTIPILVCAVALLSPAALWSFDVEPTVKTFFEDRPVPTVLNLSDLPPCCLGGEAAWRAELEATLALVPATSCTADDGLRGSAGDLLFTPFEFLDPRARESNDGVTVVRFKNQGQFTLGLTTFWVFSETQGCGGKTFNRTADADVTLNKQVAWVNDPGSGFCPGSADHFSLRSTFLHELGHVVGLEHTNVESALMFAFGDSCDFTKETFQADDQDQFDFIYACETADCQGGAGEPVESQCKDGIDNDGDGAVDCADSDCAGRGFCR